MLILEGQVWWLIAMVAVIMVASAVALLTTDNSVDAQKKPVALSDEERSSLQTIGLELRKKAQQSKRTRRKGTRGDSVEDSVTAE
ncbi:MAG: hypothetical protein KIS73_25065 [Enhydrobacter sp.]|nr:hypothetical protein [Enhydrobacter sp.]